MLYEVITGTSALPTCTMPAVGEGGSPPPVNSVLAVGPAATPDAKLRRYARASPRFVQAWFAGSAAFGRLVAKYTVPAIVSGALTTFSPSVSSG